MTIDAQNVDVKYTSFSYVAVWVRPIAIFPSLINDNLYCNSFFGDGGSSIVGQTSDGYNVVDRGTGNYLQINNNRITVSTSNQGDTIEYFNKFVKKLNEDGEYVQFAKVKAFGINFDFSLELESDSKEFINRRFSNQDVQSQIENVEYRIPLGDEDYLWVKLNSLKEEKNKIFGSINHHHNIESTPISINTYKLQFEETIKLFTDLVLNTLK